MFPFDTLMGTGGLITVGISLLLGLATGFIMHRSDFCLAGMIRDLFLFRSTFMLRILALLVVTNMVLIEVARGAGMLMVFPYPAFGPASLSNVIGGMLFGVGMVLAGGCVAGTLYKMGSGNIISIVAFVGLIAGSVAYAEFHAAWKGFAVASVILPGKVTLAQALEMPQRAVIAIVAAILATLVGRWAIHGRLVRRSHAEGYLQPWKAALLLAVLVAVSVLVIGVPLGITTSYAKIGAWVENLIAPGHAEGLAYFKAVSFNYPDRLLGLTYRGGPGPAADAISLIQFPLVLGIIAGGFLSVRLVGEFKMYYNVPRAQYVSGFIGGVLMGLAARMAPSCNVWHLLGGIPILAVQSLLFAIGLLPGAWLGGRLLAGFVLKDT